MPLNLPALQSGLESAFAEPGDTYAACAQAWADALQTYVTAVVPPSTAVAAAATALAGSLSTAFASGAAPAPMETAFLTFATALGTGMAPAFVAVPPPAPVGFAAQFAGPKPATHAAAAQQIGQLIDTWLKTATATPAVGGSPSPWA